jgi:hypothetical protein
MGYCSIEKRMSLDQSDQSPIGVGRNEPIEIPCPSASFDTELLHFEPRPKSGSAMVTES